MKKKDVVKGSVFCILVAVIMLGGMAMPVLAGDICVENSYGEYLRFHNVLLVKGSTTSFVGEWHWFSGDSPYTATLIGAVTLLSDGVTTRIVFTNYPYSPQGITATAFVMVGDKKFNATGTYYEEPFFNSSSGSDTWTNVSCNLPVFKTVE